MSTSQPGAVLAPPLWGSAVGDSGLRRGTGHLKNVVNYMYKYADFDIKPTYNQ